jgi:hypothetical protein
MYAHSHQVGNTGLYYCISIVYYCCSRLDYPRSAAYTL